ncbi:MAG: NADPH-dependent F420 reductase [Thermoanaerobaculia bacterium]
MKVGIIGAGHIGANLARLLVAQGIDVAISNSRGPTTLKALVDEIGTKLRAVTPDAAAEFGDVVVLAVPLKEFGRLPAEKLRGKAVVDAMNYYPERDGQLPILDSGELGSSEMVARRLIGARVVKAFNTIWFEHLRKQGRPDAPVEERRAIFIAGDDEAAKRDVTALIERIGFGAVDMGSLLDGRKQQPDTPVYNRDLTVAEAREMIANPSS